MNGEIIIEEEEKNKTKFKRFRLSLANKLKLNNNDDINNKRRDTLTNSHGEDTDVPERETWSKRLDFLMSIIGFSVDLAGIWRFPYLCLKNGGGAFLIPYLFMICFLGLPLFYLELAIGQYYRSGAITCWKKICPLLSGVGYAVVMIAFLTDFYYNVIISWGVYYFFNSFYKTLPWTNCDNKWNTKDCYTISSVVASNKNTTNNNSLNYLNNTHHVSSSEEFFFNRMYGLSSEIGISNLGNILWENVGCLFLIYIICYFSMWKGVKTSGKVVWFTALFPYVILLILLIQAIFLDGSLNGLYYYITPNLSLIKDPMVWMEAASQVYFSLGPGFGVLLAFSSYNNFNNNIYNILSGAVIFMYLGYMSNVTNKEINEVVKDGSSLIFIVYPESISILPFSQFWSVIFFLMLLTLGLDSSFGGSEAIITALSDEYPILRKKREIFIGFLFGFYLLVGIPSCTQGGYYIIEFMNNYAVMYSILIAVFIETITISWIYGIDTICDNINEMINIYPSFFWRFCWKYFTPCCLLFIIVMGIRAYEPLKVVRTNALYSYPEWANIVGWCLAFSSSLWIPIIAIYMLCKAEGNLIQRIKYTIKPLKDRKINNHHHNEKQEEEEKVELNL